MRRLGHVPALDGVRAIALSMVVISHAFDWPRNGNGTLGVDLFFVLSGFLITHLLLEEHAASGTVSIRAFYERRARRLLPALFAMLSVYVVVALAAGVNPAWPALAGAFYFSNFADEFLRHHNGMPVAHLWSLAQEEQFYLLWPAVLLILLRVAPRRIGVLLVAVALGLAVHRQILLAHGANTYRLFYMPDTRSDGLLLGAAAAFWHFRGSRRLDEACRFIAVAGLPLVGILFVEARVAALWTPLFIFVIAYFAAVVYAAATSASWLRVLAARPLVYLGGVSYAFYLWHVPLLWLAGPLRGQHAGVGVTLGAIAASGLLAHLSTTYLESRFRRHRGQAVRPHATWRLVALFRPGENAAWGRGDVAS